MPADKKEPEHVQRILGLRSQHRSLQVAYMPRQAAQGTSDNEPVNMLRRWRMWR